MCWEPVSLAHWEASLKAHQANQQSDARDWTNRPVPAAAPKINQSLDRLIELCDIASAMEGEL